MNWICPALPDWNHPVRFTPRLNGACDCALIVSDKQIRVNKNLPTTLISFNFSFLLLFLAIDLRQDSYIFCFRNGQQENHASRIHHAGPVLKIRLARLHDCTTARLFQAEPVTELDKENIFQIIVIVLFEQFTIKQVTHIIEIIHNTSWIITASCLAPD